MTLIKINFLRNKFKSVSAFITAFAFVSASNYLAQNLFFVYFGNIIRQIFGFYGRDIIFFFFRPPYIILRFYFFFVKRKRVKCRGIHIGIQGKFCWKKFSIFVYSSAFINIESLVHIRDNFIAQNFKFFFGVLLI